MHANKAYYNSEKPEPPAPVAGGMRWRRPYHDLIALCRRDPGLSPYDPDEPPGRAPSPPEPGAVTSPLIVSVPPSEARAGDEYAYHARAYSGDTDGFTWYLETNVAGMAVDRHTGRLTWIPSDGGYVEIALCARSLYGAESRQCWTVLVRKAVPVRRSAPNPRFRRALERKAMRRPTPFPRFRRCARRPDIPEPPAPPGRRFRAATPLRM